MEVFCASVHLWTGLKKVKTELDGTFCHGGGGTMLAVMVSEKKN